MAISVEEALRGRRILWGAPTYDQVYVGWDETKHACQDNVKFRVDRMLAEFPTGGRITYRSLDNPDNARGHTADGIVIDEVGDVKQEAWYGVLGPMLIDTGGWFWGIGTPKGHNWFWQEHFKAKDQADSMAWQVPTLGIAVENGGLIRKPHPMENPHIPFSEIYKKWLTTPERWFQQEYLAEFVEDAGVVFRRARDAATSEWVEGRSHPHQQFVMGVDWGKVDDFTVVTVMDAEHRRMVYQDRFNQIDYAVQVPRLEAIVKRFAPIMQIVVEENAMGIPLVEILQRKELPIIPFKTTNASKAQIIESLAVAFEREEIQILEDETLIAELQAFEVSKTPGGQIKYGAPQGMHDDCVIALALAWSAVGGAITSDEPVAMSLTATAKGW
jgi:hypothetical protein